MRYEKVAVVERIAKVARRWHQLKELLLQPPLEMALTAVEAAVVVVVLMVRPLSDVVEEVQTSEEVEQARPVQRVRQPRAELLKGEEAVVVVEI